MSWSPIAALGGLLLVSACASTHAPKLTATQEAAQYQARAAGDYTPPGPPEDPWGPYITEASNRFDVPERWIREVMRVESGGSLYHGGNLVTSPVGAMGLMQIMPATYDDLKAQLNLGDDPYDPHNSIIAGTAYIRQMYDLYGSPGFLAAYNAGPGTLDAYLTRNRRLPGETRRYVAMIAPYIEGSVPHNRSQADMLAMNAMQARTGAAPDAGTTELASADPLPSTPIATTPIATTPIVSTPTANAPIATTPIATTPVATAPITSAPVAAAPVPSAPIAAAPVAATPVAAAPVAVAAASAPAPARADTNAYTPAPTPSEAPPVPRPPAPAAFAIASSALPLPPAPEDEEPSPPARMADAAPPARPRHMAPQDAPRPIEVAMLPEPPPPPSRDAASTQVASFMPEPPTPPSLVKSQKLGFRLVAPAFAEAMPHRGGGAEWAIQLGAFGNQSQAHAMAGTARGQEPALLAGTRPYIASVRDGHSTLYRARLTGLSREKAIAACQKLARSKTSCLVVSPES